MTQKPQLSFWHIWNMCCGFIGIQFGFALQNANVSRIFQTLGASIDDIPLLWVAAPLTGLLVQPIIGYWSDKTWNPVGRRRPYLLFGAVAASLALFVMPNSSTLWIAAGMLWVMDASLNITLGPAIALVSDMLPEEQRATGFSVQSFFIGISAVVASSLPWVFSNLFHVSNTAAEGVIPPSVTYAFYAGGVIMLCTLLWTCRKTKEYTPEQLVAFSRYRELITNKKHTPSKPHPIAFIRYGKWFIGSGVCITLLTAALTIEPHLYILSVGLILFGSLQIIAAYLEQQQKTDNATYQITTAFFHMPATMRQLAVVQFLSWFALFCLWMYGTSAVTSHHYQTFDTASEAYGRGADWVGILFAAYNAFAALAAATIPWLVRKTSRKITHIVNLCLGGAALISFLWIDDPHWLLAAMVGVGFAWASILSLPYAILSCALPSERMGVYTGLFNFFIVIPQILACSILVLVVKYLFGGQTIYVLVLAGVLLLLAAISTLFVRDSNA